jgi:hypothetical protein
MSTSFNVPAADYSAELGGVQLPPVVREAHRGRSVGYQQREHLLPANHEPHPHTQRERERRPLAEIPHADAAVMGSGGHERLVARHFTNRACVAIHREHDFRI